LSEETMPRRQMKGEIDVTDSVFFQRWMWSDIEPLFPATHFPNGIPVAGDYEDVIAIENVPRDIARKVILRVAELSVEGRKTAEAADHYIRRLQK
jgi:hypothetical protein